MTMSSDQERMLKRSMKKSKTRGGHDEKEYKSHRLLRKFMKKKAKTQKVYKKHEFLRFIVETAMKREKMDIHTKDHIDRKIKKKIKILRKGSIPILVEPLQSKKPVFDIPYQPPLRKKEANFREVVEEVEDNISYQPPFREVVEEVEEEKAVLVSNDVDDDDYEKEVMNKKAMKMDIEDLRERSRPILVEPLQSRKPVFYISYQPPALREKEARFKEVVKVDDDDDDDDYDYEKEVMKKKMKKSSTFDKNKKNMVIKKEPLPALPLPNDEVCKLMLQRISEIGGTCPVWLAAKYMERSDVNNQQGRLFIPKCCANVLLDFLTQRERNFLIEEDKKIVKVGIPCRVVDQNGERWDLRLRYWPSVKQFIFIRNWNSVVNGFGLKMENPGKIELWCFRLPKENSNLSFGLRITS